MLELRFVQNIRNNNEKRFNSIYNLGCGPFLFMISQSLIITYVTYNFCGVCYTELTERERVTYGQQLFGEVS